MSRYFFHVMNGKAAIDTDGVEYVDMDTVRREAIRSAAEMLESGEHTWAGNAWHMFVTNETHEIVFSVKFSVDQHGL